MPRSPDAFQSADVLDAADALGSAEAAEPAASEPNPADSPNPGRGTGSERRRPPLWRVWVDACRPHTLGASLIPVGVGSALAARDEVFSTAILASCALAAVALQVATNLANDAFDFLKRIDGADRIGPVRATQAGWLSARQVFAGVGLSIAIAMVAGIELVSVGGWPIVGIGVVSILAALAYSGGPFPLASNGLGEVAAFSFFGVVAVVGTYYLYSSAWSERAGLCSLPIGGLVSAIMVVNNLRDIETDARSGKRTLAVRIGARHTRMLYATLVGASYLATAGLALVLGSLTLLLPWISIPLAASAVREVAQADDAASFQASLAHTARLHGAYGTLLCLGLTL